MSLTMESSPPTRLSSQSLVRCFVAWAQSMHRSGILAPALMVTLDHTLSGKKRASLRQAGHVPSPMGRIVTRKLGHSNSMGFSPLQVETRPRPYLCIQG